MAALVLPAIQKFNKSWWSMRSTGRPLLRARGALPSEPIDLPRRGAGAAPARRSTYLPAGRRSAAEMLVGWRISHSAPRRAFAPELRPCVACTEGPSPFVSERGSAITTWHACGFVLANAGKDTRSLQACLGQKNIQHNG